MEKIVMREQIVETLGRNLKYDPSMTYREYQQNIIKAFESIELKSKDEMKLVVKIFNEYVGSMVNFWVHKDAFGTHRTIAEFGEPIPDEAFRNYMAQPIMIFQT